MQYTRSERVAQGALVVVALVFAIVVVGVIFRSGGGAPGAAVPTATPTVKPPDVKIAHDPCCAQAARFLNAGWESSAKVDRAAVSLVPDPGFACAAQVSSGGLKGSFGCAGLLRGATEYVATLALTTIDGTFKIDHKFTTMADKLTGVQWFTEFENPSGDPLACAAASCRIVQFFTAGKDPMTAEAILALGRQFNKSADPGLDPVGIATVIKRMEPRNNYTTTGTTPARTPRSRRCTGSCAAGSRCWSSASPASTARCSSASKAPTAPTTTTPRTR